MRLAQKWGPGVRCGQVPSRAHDGQLEIHDCHLLWGIPFFSERFRMSARFPSKALPLLSGNAD